MVLECSVRGRGDESYVATPGVDGLYNVDYAIPYWLHVPNLSLSKVHLKFKCHVIQFRKAVK